MKFAALRITCAAGLLAAGAAHAADLDSINSLTQAQFRAMSEDLGAALSYKPLVPAEGLGLLGFDIAASVTGTKLQNRGVLSMASGGSSTPSVLPVAAVRAVKGLPFDIDVGVMVGSVPSIGASVSGGELRWAFVGGNTLLPALAVRAAVTKVTGIDQYKLRTSSVDLSISKGFLMATPYAGVGIVQVNSEFNGTRSEGGNMSKESFRQDKVFAGLNFNLAVLNMAVEMDKTGDTTSYGIKAGWRF